MFLGITPWKNLVISLSAVIALAFLVFIVIVGAITTAVVRKKTNTKQMQ